MVKKIGIYQDFRKPKPWIVRWYGLASMTTGKPKRYSKAFGTKDQAERFRAGQILAFGSGRPRDRAEEIKLRIFLADFLRTKRHSVRPKTHRQYQQIASRLNQFFGSDCLLRQIGTREAHCFIGELTPTSKGRDNLSEWSKQTILTYCKAIFNEAVQWELVARNPFAAVKTRKTSVPGWHYMDVGQYKAMLKAAPSLRWRVVYSLAYTCGLRKAEILNLQWPDIDFERAELTVCNRPGMATTVPFATKNCKDRQVPIPEHTISILQQWQLQQGRKRIPYVALTVRQYRNVLKRWKSYRKAGRAWENEAMANNMMREFRRHIDKAGIKPTGKLTLHTLRKCCGKNWADVIRNPKVCQELMGHADISTTMKFYNKLNRADMKEAASGIDAMLDRADAEKTPDTASA